MSLTTYQLWYGRDEAPREPRLLRAGPVTALLDGCDLRYVRLGGVTLVDRIYVAVRDRHWGTVPGQFEHVEVEAGDDRFVARFDVVHRQHDIDVVWHGAITGTPDGVITYSMDARWNAEATYKLIGLNTHHGMREYAGRPYHGHGPDGPVAGAFPVLIEPQLIVDETEVPIFPPVETLTISLTDEVAVRFDFEGDPFEVEDQRNWTDASFKAQSFMPRRQGYYTAKPGDRAWQKVAITPLGVPSLPVRAEDRIRLSVGEPVGRALPVLGFGMASHGARLSTSEADLLRLLHPDHLLVDLRLSDPRHVAALDRAVADAAMLGCGLELALFVGDDADRELSFIATRLLTLRPPVRRVLVFADGEPATPLRLSRLAWERLREVTSGALIAGGTNAHFCELNRHRPERSPDEGIVYGITPQVHAFDERSLAENAAAQAATVETARAIYGARPVIISPVTLKPRSETIAAAAPGALPAQVDPRQMSLFGAGWTVASVKYLAESGADSITYYETTGWRGVIETEIGAPLPECFPSLPGMVFPAYHIFADLAEWRGGELIGLASDDHVAVNGLAVRAGEAMHLLLTNLTFDVMSISVGPLPDGQAAIRRLHAANALPALTDPASYRATTEPLDIQGGELNLELAPFELVRIDLG